MKQLLFVTAFLLINANCFAITQPTAIDPIVVTLKMPKDQVWQRLLDVFEANKMPIKFKDKASGLIESEPLGLSKHFALDNARDSATWAVCERVRNPNGGGGAYIFPQIINAELQFFLRESADGNTLLSINMVNLTATRVNPDVNFKLQSTLKIENKLRDYFETNGPVPSLAFDPPFANYGKLPSEIEAEVAKKKDEKRKDNAKDTANSLLIALGLTALTIIGVVALVLAFGRARR
jgi:hypothetical protein